MDAFSSSLLLDEIIWGLSSLISLSQFLNSNLWYKFSNADKSCVLAFKLSQFLSISKSHRIVIRSLALGIQSSAFLKFSPTTPEN